MVACRMESFSQHIPVLLNEVTEHLVSAAGGIYVDATFGRGNHTKAILQRLNEQGRVIGFDKDAEAIAFGNKAFSKDKRLTLYHTSFARMNTLLETAGVLGKVNGILFDLGVSSPQLDNPDRGFSFTRIGKLDMRMDQTQGMDAINWIAKVGERELADVIWNYGEERYSRQIARAIVGMRNENPITTTTQLAQIITAAMPKLPKGKHAATRTFQAIRIAINEELSELQLALTQSLAALTVGGRLAVISFHSLEDRIVKQFIKQHEIGDKPPRGLPIKHFLFQQQLRQIGKPIKPTLAETNVNPRARSAILRIAEKIS